MTTLDTFAAKAKTRHDFSDRIMVRYTDAGEDYDTWVSGEEVLQRLRSEKREKQLHGISQLDFDEMKDAGKSASKKYVKQKKKGFFNRLADSVQDTLGDHAIGQGMSDKIRGRDSNQDPRAQEKANWQTRLQNPVFREKVLELAWLNLRSSLPDEDEGEYNDWV